MRERLPDLTELAFRGLFVLIFIGLGGEHVFHDQLIRLLMPEWVPYPRVASIAVGLWLLFWGGLVLLGWKIREAAIALGAFVIVVTIVVHLPAVFSYPPEIDPDDRWLWDILQRSNLVKNLCLLGVCFHLLYHRPARYSLTEWLARKDGRDGEEDAA